MAWQLQESTGNTSTESSARRSFPNPPMVLTVGIWLLVIVFGWVWATDYSFRTYQPIAQSSSKSWPTATNLQHSPRRPTLLLFLHPKCACSRATIHELNRLLADHRLREEQKPDVVLVACFPSGKESSWSRSTTISSGTKLPRSTVWMDENGRESANFGAITSGTVMLFSPTGQRLFQGGVTIARAHEGDSAGTQELTRLLLQKELARPRQFPVFGCRLCQPSGPQLSQFDTSRSLPNARTPSRRIL